MNPVRVLCLALALAGFTATSNAGMLIYTFGGDFISLGGNGAPDSLNRMDPSSSASVTNVQTPVGGGNIGFTGGLVGVGTLLYGIGNDSNGVATLYSFQTSGQGLATVSSAFNNTGDGAGVGFQNGLAAIGNTFYAIGAGASNEALYQIGGGTATLIQVLDSMGGTYAGLAWDPGLNDFYAILANDPSGDLLVRFSLGGPVSVVANLTTLDGSQIGTHLGGLADFGGGILYDIYTNPDTSTGELEGINLNGGATASTLYDTGIPLAQNAGIAFTTPEPGTGIEIGGLALLCWIVRRTAKSF